MNRYQYPETTPVLNGNDFCAGMKEYRSHYEPQETCKRCLIGHAVFTFLGQDSAVTDHYNLLPRRVKQALNYAVNKVFKMNGVKGATLVYVANDNNSATRIGRARIAKAWNIAMAYLGYTENNPEA